MVALSVIGAPTSAGAFGPGQERAPSAFRAHGLLDALRARGLDVVDRGDGRRAEWRTAQRSPEARNVNTVAAVARELADTVEGTHVHEPVLGQHDAGPRTLQEPLGVTM